MGVVRVIWFYMRQNMSLKQKKWKCIPEKVLIGMLTLRMRKNGQMTFSQRGFNWSVPLTGHVIGSVTYSYLTVTRTVSVRKRSLFRENVCIVRGRDNDVVNPE